MSETPSMSVVLVTPDRYERIRKTISFLAAQTQSSALEIVIVSPAELTDAQDELWARFHNVKLVLAGRFESPAFPRVAGVMKCSGAIVGFSEDHCFPCPKWAETLMGAYADGAAAAAPALGNANPGAVSWADFLLNFGPSAHPAIAGSVTRTPSHNTSYRRDLLLEYGDKLGPMLEAEIALQQDLIRRGYRIYLAGNLEAKHVNLSRWQSFLHNQMWGGRLYGSARAEAGAWSVARRWLYAAAFPLIPAVRALQIASHARRTMPQVRNAGFFVACAGGLLASAVGEIAGYVLGVGPAQQVRFTYEFDRVRHLRPADRTLLP